MTFYTNSQDILWVNDNVNIFLIRFIILELMCSNRSSRVIHFPISGILKFGLAIIHSLLFAFVLNFVHLSFQKRKK